MKPETTLITPSGIFRQIEVKSQGKTDMISLMVNTAIEDNQPSAEILKTLSSMATDNRSLIAKIFGEELTNLILKFK